MSGKINVDADCDKVDENACKWAKGQTEDVPAKFKAQIKGLPDAVLTKMKNALLKCAACKTSNSSKSSNHELIIGLSIGGGALLIAGIIFIIIMMRRNR